MTFDLPYIWVISATLAAFGIFLVMCLFVTWRIYRVKRRETRHEQNIDIWRSWLAHPQAFCRNPNTPAIAREDRPAFLELWVYWASLLMPDTRQPLRELADKLGIPGWLKSELRAIPLHHRLVAVRAAGYLHYAPSARKLRRILRDRSAEISLTAAGALLEFGDTYRNTVIETMANRQDWTVRALVRMVSEHNNDDFFQMLQTAALRKDAQGLRMLRVLLEARPSLAGSFLEKDLPPDHQCRALRKLIDSRYLPQVIARLSHPEWPVRLHAARALGRLGAATQIRYLTPLLNDSNEWVRYRAAQAIVSLLDKNPELRQANLRMRVSEQGRDAMERALAEYHKRKPR